MCGCCGCFVFLITVFFDIIRWFSSFVENFWDFDCFCTKLVILWLQATKQWNNRVENHQKSPKSRFWWKSTYFRLSTNHKRMILFNKNYGFWSTMEKFSPAAGTLPGDSLSGGAVSDCLIRGDLTAPKTHVTLVNVWPFWSILVSL